MSDTGMAKPSIVRVDLDSAVPVYLQISAQLRALLVSGELRPGLRLPTVRQLAMDLGVHHNTVAEAYRRVAEEGWLELRRGRGARVVRRPDPKMRAGAREEFSRRLEALVAEAAAEGLASGAIAWEFEQIKRKLWRGEKS